VSLLSNLRRRAIAAIYRPLIARHERFVASYKRDLFRGISGRVLEIGPGPGSNLAYLSDVDHWVGVEPNRFMHPMIRAELARRSIDGTVLEESAESLPFEDETFDAVIGTLVLCSVRDPRRVVAESARVLRPGGTYAFIEHVAAPRGTRLRRIQEWVRPIWRCCGDGCCPDRETQETLRQSRFDRLEFEEFRAPPWTLPAVVSPHIAGRAWIDGAKR